MVEKKFLSKREKEEEIRVCDRVAAAAAKEE